MRVARCVWSTLLLVLVLAAGLSAAPTVRRISIATGGTGGVYFVLGGGLALAASGERVGLTFRQLLERAAHGVPAAATPAWAASLLRAAALASLAAAVPFLKGEPSCQTGGMSR